MTEAQQTFIFLIAPFICGGIFFVLAIIVMAVRGIAGEIAWQKFNQKEAK